MIQPNEKTNKLKVWVVIAGILIFVYLIAFTNADGATDSGIEAEINLFPANAEAKNYRLPATISSEKHMTFPFNSYYLYTVDDYTWPNADESTEFTNNCTIDSRKKSTICEASDGREYRVEVINIPEATSDEYESTNWYE